MDLSFLPVTALACLAVMVIIIWWERRNKIRWQTNNGYFEEDEEKHNAVKNQDSIITPNNQDNANNLSSTLLNEEIDELDELFVVETFAADKKISEEDKEHQLKIMLEEQNYLEELAGRNITTEIKKDTLKAFFQKVKTTLLIIITIIIFASLIIMAIIAGQNQWLG